MTKLRVHHHHRNFLLGKGVDIVEVQYYSWIYIMVSFRLLQVSSGGALPKMRYTSVNMGIIVKLICTCGENVKSVDLRSASPLA